MSRLFLFLLLIFALAFGVSWLADHPGSVAIEFQDWVINSSMAGLVAVIGLLMGLVALLVVLIGYLSREMPFFGSNRVIKRQGRGLTLLNQSMIALGAGDAGLARRLAEEAEVLLPPQPMVSLIAAEAAMRGGDTEEAARRFEELRKSEDGQLLGLRGLTQQAEAAGRSEEALLLAREALKISHKGGKKSNPWVLKTIFALEVQASNWQSALETLKVIERNKLFDSDKIIHHRSALHYASAIDHKLAGTLDLARKEFLAAVKTRPSFTEAHGGLARLDAEKGKMKQAITQLHKGWQSRPHRALSDQLLALDPLQTASEQLKAIRALVGMNPDHILSKIILAEALEKNEQSEAAADILASVRDHMGLDFHEVVPDDSSFQCLDCGARAEHWSLTCTSCGSFNSLRWFDAFDPEMTTLTTIREKPVFTSIISADG